MPIEINNLSYIYNPKAAFKKQALEDISLSINDGDFFGIIGHTGSGKSTLISHFNGLTKLMHGAAVVDGIDLSKKYDYKQLRSRVGMLFQYPEHQLFDETVRRDVGFGPRNLGLSQDEVDQRVKEAITLVGLDYDRIAERSPFELSGGQMRRVALAGVLAMRPQILVLDEPTAGLDPKGKAQILELIHAVRAECPTTIMISHNMDEIFENCGRIAVLSAGRLKGVFTPAELYANSEIIRESGLDMPRIFQLASVLNQHGFALEGIKDFSDLVDKIAEQTNATKPVNSANFASQTALDSNLDSSLNSDSNSNSNSNSNSDSKEILAQDKKQAAEEGER